MHRCVAIGCTATIQRGMLMCRPHWHQVPKPLQLGVHRAWRSFRGCKSIESMHSYNAAVKAAIDAVYAFQTGSKPTL